MPLRQFGISFGFENDSLISGRGFWRGEDEGYTFGNSVSLSWLWEDVQNPDAEVVKVSIVAGSFLSTRFEGSETPEGERQQFPREENLFLLNIQGGRDCYFRFLYGARYINFGERGISTSEQYYFHRWHPSQNIHNLDIGRSNDLDILCGWGLGGETTLLGEWSLVRGDIGLLTDLGEPKNLEISTQCELLLGISKVSDGAICPLSFSARCDTKWVTETQDLQLNTTLGVEWNVLVSEEWTLSTKLYARIPTYYLQEDFYDPNPEMILGVSVGFVWDSGWRNSG